MRVTVLGMARLVGLALALWFGGRHAACAETLPPVVRIGLPGSVGPDGKPVMGGTLGTTGIRTIEAAFAGTGTRIEWSYYVNAGPAINEAFAAHAIDFTLYGDLPGIIARAGGIKIKVIAPGTRGQDSYLVVPPDSPARSIADLKGKRIGINLGRPWVLAFSHLLQANGLTMGDFQLFNLVMPDGDAAVAAHRIDAQYTMNGPQLEARHAAKVIWSTREAPLSWRFTAELWASEDVIARYPDAAARLVRAYVEIAHQAGLPENRQAYLDGLAAAQGTTADAIAPAWDGIAVRDRFVPLFDPFLRAHYEQAIAFARESKLIRQDVAVDDLFETRFDEAALQTPGLAEFWTPVDAAGKPVR